MAGPTALKEDPAWHLKGGMITGGFVTPAARRDWPRWMQVLGGARSATQADLRDTDLAKVPDVWLPRAVELLEQHRVFNGKLLRQATGVMHAAPTVAWQKAKTSYQKACVEALGLPTSDVQTCSRVMTQLCKEGHALTVKAAFEATPFPEDPKLRAAFRRMLDVELRRGAATPAVVLDRTRPALERLHAFVNLRHPDEVPRLLESLKGTEALGQAAFHAVTKSWIDLTHPVVKEAMKAKRDTGEQVPWFMVRPVERGSDLRWMRIAELLDRGERPQAMELAKELVRETPASWYAGHAAALAGQGAALKLRAPGDLTLLNAPAFVGQVKPVPSAWPEPWKALAEQRRYDLILLQADPDQQPEIFLQAAHAAGQIDLVGRFLSVERRFSPETMAYTYPTFLAPVVTRLIREEGVQGLVDPAFVLAMMKNESLFQPAALSNAHAYGLLQLLKPTFRAMMGRQADILDPETNVRGGLRYYGRVAKTAGLAGLPAVVRQAYLCAGYHAGEGRARRWKNDIEARTQNRTGAVETLLRLEGIPITSTRQYITRVLGDAEIYRALLAAEKR